MTLEAATVKLISTFLEIRFGRYAGSVARITGLGGVFYKVADPDRTRAWYQETLGIGGEWGAMFPFKIDDRGLRSVLAVQGPGPTISSRANSRSW